MTRRQFNLLLVTALNEQSRQIARILYAKQPHRGERNRAKLAPTTGTKTPKVRGKGRAVATKNRLT